MRKRRRVTFGLKIEASSTQLLCSTVKSKHEHHSDISLCLSDKNCRPALVWCSALLLTIPFNLLSSSCYSVVLNKDHFKANYSLHPSYLVYTPVVPLKFPVNNIKFSNSTYSCTGKLLYRETILRWPTSVTENLVLIRLLTVAYNTGILFS